MGRCIGHRNGWASLVGLASCHHCIEEGAVLRRYYKVAFALDLQRLHRQRNRNRFGSAGRTAAQKIAVFDRSPVARVQLAVLAIGTLVAATALARDLKQRHQDLLFAGHPGLSIG
jgi:hypothetical protein